MRFASAVRRFKRSPPFRTPADGTMFSWLVCVDESQLLGLKQTRKQKTLWEFLPNIPPPPKPPVSAKRNDDARAELEEAALEEFAAEAGGESCRSPEMQLWRAAYVRRRLTCVVRGARAALEGTKAPSSLQDEQRSATRKKDAPEHGDRKRVQAFMAAQSEQAALNRLRAGGTRQSRVVASASKRLPGGSMVWEGPTEGSSSFAYGVHDGAAQPKAARRRVVVDDLASASECRHAIGASMLGMDGLDEPESSAYNGERTLVASPPELLKPFLGEGGARLVRRLLARIRDAVRVHFEEGRPLFLSGALLTRLQPPPSRTAAEQSKAAGGSYVYSVAHVDRANVASYDYSAVLYLNSKGVGFTGGDFRFVDAKGDEVVEPRSGRCVLFPSGFVRPRAFHALPCPSMTFHDLPSMMFHGVFFPSGFVRPRTFHDLPWPSFHDLPSMTFQGVLFPSGCVRPRASSHSPRARTHPASRPRLLIFSCSRRTVDRRTSTECAM